MLGLSNTLINAIIKSLPVLYFHSGKYQLPVDVIFMVVVYHNIYMNQIGESISILEIPIICAELYRDGKARRKTFVIIVQEESFQGGGVGLFSVGG